MPQIILLSIAGATLGVAIYQGYFKKNHEFARNLALVASVFGFTAIFAS